MDIQYDFINLVTIGNFNPAIATSKFVSELYSIELDTIILKTPEQFPFPKELNINNNKILFIDLDRLHIQESNIQELEKCICCEYTQKYINKLNYTPIRAAGINFRLKLNLSKEEQHNFLNKLNDKNNIFALFDVSKFNYKVEKTCNKSQSDISNVIEIGYQIFDDLTSSIKIINNNEYLVLNHNIEINGLNENKKNIEKITKNYKKILDFHLSTLKKLN